MPQTSTAPGTTEGSRNIWDELKAQGIGDDAIRAAVDYGKTYYNPSASEQEKKDASKKLEADAKKVAIAVGASVGAFYAGAACAPIGLTPLCGAVGGIIGGLLGGWIADGIIGLFKKYESPYEFCNLVPTKDERQWCTTVTTWWNWHGNHLSVENEFLLFKCWKDNGFLGSLSDKDISWNVVNAVVTTNGNAVYRTNPLDDVNKAGPAAFAPIRFGRFVLTQEGGYGMLKKIQGEKPDLKALACIEPYTKDLSYLIMTCLMIEETVKSGNYSKYDSGEINYNTFADGSGQGIGGNKALEIEAVNKSFVALAENFDNDFKKVLENFGVFLQDENEESIPFWVWILVAIFGFGLIFGIIYATSRKKSKE